MVWLQVFFPIKKGGFAEQKGAIYPLIIVSKESFSITPPNTHTHTPRSHCYPLFNSSAIHSCGSDGAHKSYWLSWGADLFEFRTSEYWPPDTCLIKQQQAGVRVRLLKCSHGGA